MSSITPFSSASSSATGLKAYPSLYSALSGALGSLSSLQVDLESATKEGGASATTAIPIMESMMALESDVATITSNIPASATEMIALPTPLAAVAELLSIQEVFWSTDSPASMTPPLLVALSSVLASTTSGISVSATGTAVSTPTPFQAGMVAGCTQFHLVVANDTCSSIASAAGISLSDFHTWNPAVGSSCASLDVADNVCVGVGT
jgi:hypothetical protein